MGKSKTSKKQEISLELSPFDPDEGLRKMKPRDILDTLIFCIENEDYDSFSEVLLAYFLVHNKADIAKKMGVSRRALYHMLSKEGNPTIRNLMKFFRAIKKEA
jgi:DNA-binding phage protein